jgi:anti-sigma regulatory factor (Ser/Thr protein kinase)
VPPTKVPMGYEVPISNLASAREMVRVRLRGQPIETVEIATLLTDELLANAMQHGAGNPTLALEVVGSQLCVRVRDDDSTVDIVPLAIEPWSERGRGLAIVNALATEWGVDPRPYGKVVWFSLKL